MAVRSASLAAFIFPKELAKFCAVGKRFCLKSLVKERYFVILHFYLYTLEQVGACMPFFFRRMEMGVSLPMKSFETKGTMCAASYT